jgi:hypothetical protein
MLVLSSTIARRIFSIFISPLFQYVMSFLSDFLLPFRKLARFLKSKGQRTFKKVTPW